LRDTTTGQSRGTGYVNFKTEAAAALALKLDGSEVLNRPIRVRPYVSRENRQDKNKEKGKKRDHSSQGGKPAKKFKDHLGKPAVKVKINASYFCSIPSRDDRLRETLSSEAPRKKLIR